MAGAVASAGATERPLLALINPAGRMSYLEDGKARGPMPEFFREVGQRARVGLDVEVVPRARLLAQVESAACDLFVGVRMPVLESRGEFVPLLNLHVMLLHDRRLSAEVPKDMASLMAKTEWRALFVRGIGLSKANQVWIERLEAQHRLTLVSDWKTVVRMLVAGRAEFSFFTPTFLRGEVEALPAEVRDRLITRPMPELTPHEIGLYVGRHLEPKLRRRLVQSAEAALREGVFRSLVQRVYPGEPLAQDFQLLDLPPKKDSR